MLFNYDYYYYFSNRVASGRIHESNEVSLHSFKQTNKNILSHVLSYSHLLSLDSSRKEKLTLYIK